MKVPKYKWAKEVRRQWDYKCAYCGKSEADNWNIQAHHIVPKTIAPELATDTTNGIALCRKHHYAAHCGDYINTKTYEQCKQDRAYKYFADVIEFVEEQRRRLNLPIG